MFMCMLVTVCVLGMMLIVGFDEYGSDGNVDVEVSVDIDVRVDDDVIIVLHVVGKFQCDGDYGADGLVNASIGDGNDMNVGGAFGKHCGCGEIV